MSGLSQPAVKDVVLVGAGHAHVEVLRSFGMNPLPGTRITLITPDAHTPYSGMLPGLVAGRYSFDEAHIDTRPLARFAGARLFLSAAIGIDMEARRVICNNRAPVPYDVLSINTGSTPNTAAVPGAADHATPVKPIAGFLSQLAALDERIEASGWRRRIAIVGGGAGSVELALALEARLRRQAAYAGGDPSGISYVLVSGGDTLLSDFPRGFQHRFREILSRRGIEVVTGARVTGVLPGRMQIAGRADMAADEILWTTQAQPPDWLGSTGLALDDGGFVKVDPLLRAEGREDVFAAGDVIAFGPRPLPKSGVYSVRAGPVLADNIRRLLTGRGLTAFRPQRHALYLVSTAEDYAVGTRNGFVFAGKWVWRWKDRIDRRFMERFKVLPDAPRGS
jgi:selenide,water dikinase